jgi:hypothetical protein
MKRWLLATAGTIIAVALTVAQERPATRPADSQPASQPSGGRGTLRRTQQADILRKLLDQNERPTPILPQNPDGSAAAEEKNAALLLEGTFITERPGRLVREDGRAKFVFNAEGGGQTSRTVELLPSQLLELMEREAAAGYAEFIVSGEITRFHDRNYLLLRKLLRRAGHGNLSP